MSRLQKKCFIVSGATHLLLIVLLVVGPALMPKRTARDGEQFNMIKVVGTLTDEPTRGGAHAEQLSVPTPPTPPTPLQPTQQVSDPTPPKPAPVPVKPEPQKPAPTRETQSRPDDFKVASRPNSGRTSPATNTNQHSNVQVADNSRVGQGLQNAIKNLNHSLVNGSAVVIPMPGEGDGGPAMSNYRDLVYTTYYNAWHPLGVSDAALVADAQITIARNGQVISSEISKRSGNVELDKSVQSTLDKVTALDPFPENSKDLKRTYILEFDLSAKRQM